MVYGHQDIDISGMGGEKTREQLQKRAISLYTCKKPPGVRRLLRGLCYELPLSKPA